jgi:ferrous iron transport protein B
VEYHPDIERGIQEISELIPDPAIPRRAVAIRLLEAPESIADLATKDWGAECASRCESIVRAVQERFSRSLGVVMAGTRIRQAEAILDEVVSVSPPLRLPLSDRLGRWARHPVTGIPTAVVVVAAMYLFVGRVGAQWLVGLVEGGLFQDRLIPWVESLLEPVPWGIVRDAIVGEFGLLSVGVTLAVGIVMPVLVTFFFAFNLLEDSGYLARLSILLDRGLRKIGVGGRGLFPLVMGFSCITMALLTTRVLGTRKERIIASLLLMLGLPCAPLLSVMLVVMAPMHWTAPIFVFGVIFIQILTIGHIASRALPGRRSEFIFTVPPLRIPKIGAILRKTATRSWWFVVEAVPFFLVATFGLFILDRLGGLQVIERAARPVVSGILRLPAETVDVFIMTMVRREAGAALLKPLADAGGMTSLEVVITLLVMTFFSPCVNALLVLFKERGFWTALAIIGFITPYAVALGGFLHWLLRLLGVTFR